MGVDWFGVIVKDSLMDNSVLDIVGILKSRSKELGVSAMWEVFDVSVDEPDINTVVSKLEKGLRPSWYAYFTREDNIIIVFKGKSFRIKKGSKASLKRVRDYAFKEHNIPPDFLTLDI